MSRLLHQGFGSYSVSAKPISFRALRRTSALGKSGEENGKVSAAPCTCTRGVGAVLLDRGNGEYVEGQTNSNTLVGSPKAGKTHLRISGIARRRVGAFAVLGPKRAEGDGSFGERGCLSEVLEKWEVTQCTFDGLHIAAKQRKRGSVEISKRRAPLG